MLIPMFSLAESPVSRAPERITIEDSVPVADVVRERIENARQNHLDARQRYVVARNRFAEAKSDFRNNLSDYGQLRNEFRDATPEKREGISERLRHKSRAVVLNQVEAILNHLNAVSEKDVAPENIGELIDFFEEKKTQLEDESLSQEEVRVISSEIRGFWNDHRLDYKKRIGENLNEKIIILIEKMESFSERLSVTIGELKEQGKDTKLLERGLEKLNKDTERLKEAYEKLKEKYDSNSENERILRNGSNLLKVSYKQLKHDLRLIKSLFNATRKLNSSEIDAETQEELEGLINESTSELDVFLEEL